MPFALFWTGEVILTHAVRALRGQVGTDPVAIVSRLSAELFNQTHILVY